MSSVSPFVTPTIPTTELDRVFNLPYTDKVLDLFERFREKKLDDVGIIDFLGTLDQANPEIQKAQSFLASPGNIIPDLSTRDAQLAWAALLAHVSQTLPPAQVRRHKIWSVLTADSRLSGSLGTSARYIDLAVSNRTVTMDWGTPGTWFYFAPDHNHINIDLFFTLAAGFDDDQAPNLFGVAHATAVMMHEVGHSQLTKRFTDEMLALQKEEKNYRDLEKRNGKLTRDEFKELSKVRKEFELRMMVLNAAEDNCVNQYAANQGAQFPHDFGKSLNISNVLLQGSGQILRKGANVPKPTNPVEEAQAALNQLCQVLGSAFHTTNGLFDTFDAATWQRLGVNINAFKTDPKKLAKSETAFEHLMDMAIGPRGLSQLQPRIRDRWLLQSLFNSSVRNFADRRCRIVDDIWNQYAKDAAQIIIDAYDGEVDKALDQAAQNQSDNSTTAAGPGEGEGQSESLGTDNESGTPDNATDGNASARGAPLDVHVEGVGTVTIGKPLPKDPAAAEAAARGEGSDASADTGDPDDTMAQTIRDLLKTLREMEKSAGIDNGDDGGVPELPSDNGLTPMNGPGGRSRGVDLKTLSGGSWIDFRKNINELEPVVSRVVENLRYIRERQRQVTRTLTDTLEILPRGGNVRDRLDMRRHIDFVMKRITGQKINEDDLRRWRREDAQTEATSVELWVLGDGSGSMEYGLPGGGRRIDSAVQSMAILCEAGRRADFDTYVGMWGDDHIRLVADPHTPERELGNAFEQIRNGINSGTQLTPSFQQAVGLSAKGGLDKNGRARNFAGMTHFLIISDGELNYGDIKPATQALLELFRYGPAVSIDIAILGGSGDEMRQVVDAVREENPRALIDIVASNDASDIPLLLADRIKKRFEQARQEQRAVPDTHKREAFKRVHRSFEPA